MRLLQLHIENFGGLQDCDLDFSTGLNTLQRPNGWGKSTLAVFIKAMLYGLPAVTKRSLDENERKKYAPWQGGIYGGNLSFSTAEGSYRIERSFGEREAQDTLAIYDLATHLPTNRFSNQPGLDLFGIDADSFERTVYLSQRAINEKSEQMTGITAKLGDLLDDVDDIGSYDRAMELLEKRRRYFVLRGDRGRISDLEEELVALEKEEARLLARQEAEEVKQAEHRAAERERETLRAELETLRASLKHAALAREREALEAQKGAMLEELSRITLTLRELDTALCGRHPKEDELDRMSAAADSLHDARVRLKAQEPSPETVARLEALRRRFPKGAPSPEVREELISHARALLESARRRETWKREDASRHLPTEAELESARAALARAAAIAPLPPEGEPKRLSRLPGILLLLLGFAVTLTSFLPVSKGLLHILCLILGPLCLFGGIALLLATARRERSLREKAAASRREKESELARRRETEFLHTRAFLANYGITTSADPAEALHTLALQVREEAWRQKQYRSELATITREEEAHREALAAGLSPFGKALPAAPEETLRLVLSLSREAEELSGLEQDARARAAARAEEEARIAGLSALLRPFLSLYDPNHALPPKRCVLQVAEREREYRRLLAEETQRKAELQRFLAEKLPPSPAHEESTAEDYDSLHRRETELNARIDAAGERCNRLLRDLDALSADADGLPELRRRLTDTREALTEARAEYLTVKKTAELLTEAKTALSTRYLDGMQTALTEYLGMLRGEDTPAPVMDAGFEVSLRTGGRTRPMESFSRGERDAVRFCRRLSLTSALYAEGEQPPLILDDPFVNLDDDAMRAARSLLSRLSERYQILYLVCREDRA